MLDRDYEAELARRYQDMSDEQLAILAEKQEELTEIARELVLKETRRRRMEVAPLQSEPPRAGFDEEYTGNPEISRGERKLWYTRPGDYAELAPPECVFPMSETDDWHAVRVSLALAGIPCDEFWPGRKADLRGPMLAVLPEDRDRARAILAATVSEQAKAQMQEELDAPDDWQPPCCPQCGEPDALLTSTNPVNTWRCEVCGHTWMDNPI